MNHPLVRKPFAGIAVPVFQDLERQHVKFRAARSPVTNRPGHAIGNNRAMLICDRYLRTFDASEILRRRYTRLVQMAAVNERRIGSQQLNRSDLKIAALADRFARVAVSWLGNMICFHDAQQARAISRVAGSHCSGGLLIGDPSRLTQTELPGSLD